MPASYVNHLGYVREVYKTVELYVSTVWGKEATFDVLEEQRTILIHLDSPSEGERYKRQVEMAARLLTLKEADCPLCREMAEVGGDEVFESTPTDKVNA